MISKIVSTIIGLIFYQSPLLKYSPDEIMEFEKIYSDALRHNSEIIYTSRYPKYRFIQYISLSKLVIMHGSNHKKIVEFETRRQTLFNGKYIDAVFATKDGIWAIFYAVFDRHKLVDNFRNACITVRKGKNKYYFFSLTRQTLNKKPWMNGVVYFLPQEFFGKQSSSIVSFDEWISREPVKPITKIKVEPEDFYFLDKVSCHKPHESVLTSWFLYKFRTKLRTKKR